MSRLTAFLLGAASAACVIQQANAATFHTQQILLLGSSQVAATAINDKETIVGEVEAPGSEFQTGFVLQAGAVWQLAGVPTAINRAGAVTGYSSNSDSGFLWQNGSIVSNVSFPLGSFEGVPLTPVLNRFGELAFSSGFGSTQVANAGKPGHIHPLHGLSPLSAVVASINDSGVVAGFERIMVQGQPRQAVFAGKAGLFDMLLSPTGGNVSGGFVNNAGQVAFTDGSLGYIYGTHGITSFTPPVQTYGMQVQGINDTGRVVGIYTDATQSPAVQRAFLYNGATFSIIGTYAGTDTVHVAVNNHNTMVVSDTVPSQGTMQSYRVRCSGDGC